MFCATYADKKVLTANVTTHDVYIHVHVPLKYTNGNFPYASSSVIIKGNRKSGQWL